MPWALRPMCREPGCPNKANQISSYCDAHARKNAAAQREKRNQHKQETLRNSAEARELHAFYKSKRWQRLRGMVIAKEPLCRACQRPTEMADHIVPIRQGGSRWSMENLQGLCHACHNAKRGRESKESLKKKARDG